jgi:thioredoxin-related protein
MRTIAQRPLRTFWTTCTLAVLVIASLWTRPAQGQDLSWHPFEDALAVADTSDRPVLVDVWAPWCGWCHKMKREVYPSPTVRPCLADHFVLTRLDRTDTEPSIRYRGQLHSPLRLAQSLHADQVPALVVLNADGSYLLHTTGFLKPTPLRTLLGYVASGAHREVSFDAYRQRGNSGCERAASRTSDS